MTDILIHSLGKYGKRLAMRPLGRKVQEALDQVLRDAPAGAVTVLDFKGVEMMDYSFADEALGTIYSRMAAREYKDKYLVLASRGDEVDEALLENVEVALQQREVAAMVVPANGPTRTKGKNPNWRVIGDLPEHLVETLRAVIEKRQATVRDLVESLELDSVTACNNRIARLHQLHLVRRKAAIVPEGGRLYCYSGVV